MGRIIAIWGSRRDHCNDSYECNPYTLSKDVTADRQRQIHPRRNFNGTSILILHSTPLDQCDRHSGDIWASSQKYCQPPFRLHPADALVDYIRWNVLTTIGAISPIVEKLEIAWKIIFAKNIFSFYYLLIILKYIHHIFLLLCKYADIYIVVICIRQLQLRIHSLYMCI